jgi:uncharacterized protein YndB with AHSA1/START domain
MPDILHRLTINAPREQVHEMVATRSGLERWWTARPVGGGERVGGKLLFYFGGDDPSAMMEIAAEHARSGRVTVRRRARRLEEHQDHVLDQARSKRRNDAAL